jgi:hypothetical protein
MPPRRLTVLFADDHIPDEARLALPADQVKAHYGRRIESQFHKRTPQFREEATAGFVFTQRAVQGLQDGQFELFRANDFADALKQVEARHFDIAIVDLGWMMDPKVPEWKQPSAGWDIAQAIDAADTLAGHTTAKILYSSRLISDPKILADAAHAKMLPVLKPAPRWFEDGNAAQLGIDSLQAAVRYLAAEVHEGSPTFRTAQHEARQQAIERRFQEAPLEAERTWRRLAMGAAIASLMLVFGGIAFAMLGKLDVFALSELCGILATAVSGLAFREYHNARNEATKMERLMAQAHAPPSSG